MSNSDLYIALPAFNEAKVLKKVLSDLTNHGYNKVIVVDDGSSDKTYEIAKKCGAIVLRHIQNRGAGAASQTAVDFARENGVEFLMLMDADGQHHTKDIENLYAEILKGHHDIIIGNRFDTGMNRIPRIRIIFNRMANMLTNVFCEKNYSDSQSGFRILNRQAIDGLNLKVDGYGFCSEMIIVGENEGLRIGEIPIKVSYTEYSMSKGQSFVKGLSTAFNFLWRIIFN